MNKFVEYLRMIITNEINSAIIDNAHGINNRNIDDHLITPVLNTYIDSMNDNLKHEFWTVLEESPYDKSGYTIFFDPNIKKFGLGARDPSDKLISLGIYGSFIEALTGM